jgi:hypothetical protein
MGVDPPAAHSLGITDRDAEARRVRYRRCSLHEEDQRRLGAGTLNVDLGADTS